MDVLVVGAGVIGLSTAVVLAEGGRDVTVWTRQAPEDTTSAVASAMVGPGIIPLDDIASQWERVSIAEFTALADDPATGVALRRGRLAARTPMGPPPGVDGPTPATSDELPPGFAEASWATLPLVDMPVYLRHLTARLEAAGGRIEHHPVSTLDEAAEAAPLVANCTGLGARTLVPDDSVRPTRGQHVIVTNPGIEEFFVEAPFVPRWVAYWPYPDHVVLGGMKADDDLTEPDLALAEQIVADCIVVEPRLADARVLAHQVGLRPTRPSVRLEVEPRGAARIVHDYGHGGSGVTLSWGCARTAAELLLA